MADNPFPADFDPSGGYVVTDAIAKIYSAFEPFVTADPKVYVHLEVGAGGGYFSGGGATD